VIVKIFNKNSMGQNIYLCHCKATGEGILIDAGCNTADEKAILTAISENSITVKAILLTHGHYDHVTGVEKIKQATGAKVYCHICEKQMLENPELNLSCLTANKIYVTPDEIFNDGDTFQFGQCMVKILHTPGHTPGGVCYYNEDCGLLFSGDTLFKSSIGRTDFPQGDQQKLIRNINAKLLTLPEDVAVYPGHGDSTTIGREKKQNPFLKV